MMAVPRRGLYAIADAGDGTRDLVTFSQAVLRGGASVLQYRAKTRPCIEVAGQIRDMCHRYGVPFIVNDDVNLAEKLAADGIHLGRADVDCRHARQRFGARMIIGVSCYNALSAALSAINAGADYVAFGAFYPSRSKPAATRAPLELLKQAQATLERPIVAIGGICPQNAPSLLSAGAGLLAVISDLMDSADPEQRARLYNTLIHNHAGPRRGRER